MTQHEQWAAREMRRWLRPDAARWFRQDYRRFIRAECKAGFNALQPRDDLGRWVATDVEDDQEEELDADRKLDEYSDASRIKGHHFVARSIYRNLPLSAEAKAVFDKATTGPLQSGPHGWSKGHEQYNKAATEYFERFLRVNDIKPETMTEDQAKAFVDSIKRSTDPRIRDFNLNIYRRELRYLIRFGPRRLE